MALGLVALVVVAALAVGAVVVLRGGSAEPGAALAATSADTTATVTAQQALVEAVVSGDEAAIDAAAGDVPEATPVDLGEDATVTATATGLATAVFDAAAGESYSVAASLADDAAAAPSVAVLAPEGPAQAGGALVDATVDGPHTVVVAAPDHAGDEVTVTVSAVEVTPLATDGDGSVDAEIAEPGGAALFEVEALAGDHFLVEVDDEDLAATVTGPDGAEIATTVDADLGLPRFVAEADGTYRVRVDGGADEVTGPFAIEVLRVPEFYFFYDSDDPELVIETTVEEFQPLVDGRDNRAHFCLFLREGVTMDLDIAPSSLGLDMGIDVFDETESGGLVARVNEFGPGIPEVWSVTARQDVVRCFQLWGVDFTGGGFVVRFTTSS